MPMPKGYMLYDIDPEWLRQKYEDEGLSSVDIASMCPYSTNSILRMLDRFGIKRRTKAESVKTGKSREKRSQSMSGQMVGEANPMYKGGYVTNGYRKIGRKQYSHIVAEKKIGREIRPDEVVHHINGIKTDNSPENLQVMTRSEHVALHQINGGYRKGMKIGEKKGGQADDRAASKL